MSFWVILKFWSTENSQKIRSSDEILMWFIKNFDQLTKNEFDQMPKLLENFDQLKMSSEIRSSDRFSNYLLITVVNCWQHALSFTTNLTPSLESVTNLTTPRKIYDDLKD